MSSALLTIAASTLFLLPLAETKGAAKAKQKVLDALRAIGPDPRVESAQFKSQIIAAKGRLHELRDWQHWANNKLRERICERAEEIPGSGMHPDAVTARLRELRRLKRNTNSSR